MKENWKSIKNYEGLYSISNFGRIKRKINRYGNSSNRILKNVKDTNYLIITLSKNNIHKNFLIHRLVIKHFKNNKYNLPQTNHKDGNKLNNNISNLEYITPKGNRIHAIKFLGVKIVKGEDCGASKLKNKDILEIRKLYKSGEYSMASIGKLFNVGHNPIWKIIHKKTWKHIK